MNNEDEIARQPDMLYHYTTAQGLQGILESRAIWATDIHYLNDYTELVDSKERLLEIMRSLAAKPGRGHRILAQQFVARIENEQWPDLRAKPSGPFVSCFCSGGDLLSQWRGYGQGGYALGFRRSAIDAFASRRALEVDAGHDGVATIGRIALTRVEYAADAQERILQRAAEWIVDPPEGSPVGAGQSTWVASAAAASIKRDSFAEEREWRLIVSRHGARQERFRISPSGMFIPYLSVPLDLDESLVSIVVGPNDGQDSRRSDQRMAGVERLLGHYGMAEGVSVIPSAVPFRGV